MRPACLSKDLPSAIEDDWVLIQQHDMCQNCHEDSAKDASVPFHDIGYDASRNRKKGRSACEDADRGHQHSSLQSMQQRTSLAREDYHHARRSDLEAQQDLKLSVQVLVLSLIHI